MMQAVANAADQNRRRKSKPEALAETVAPKALVGASRAGVHGDVPSVGAQGDAMVAARSSASAGSVPLSDRLCVTLPEAARIVGVSVATLYRLRATGRLRFLRVGSRTLVAGDDLRLLVADALAKGF